MSAFKEHTNKVETEHVEGISTPPGPMESHAGHAEKDLANLPFVPGSDEEKRLVRKIDRHMLPILWLMYVFNYIDRTNIGNAKVGGMQADLHLTSSDYSLILSIFFVGYLLFEVPSNMILSRSKPSIFLPCVMFTWGSVSIAAKGVTSLGGMIAFRICLGIIESGFFPGVMLLLSCWYRPSELSKRMALFYTASLVSGAFGGLMAGGIISGLEGVGGTRGWKWLFIIEGLITVCIASVAFFILPNYPTTTKWLSEEEKLLAVRRLQLKSGHEEVEISHRKALVAAFKDPKTYVFMITYNIITSVGTISYFFPTLMTYLGYKGNKAQFMTVPIYIVSLVIALAMGWNADRTRQKAWHIVAACIWGCASFIICVTVSKPSVRYAFICFGGAAIWTAIPIFLSWMVTMFDGREKRAVSIAIINGVGNTASIYGSFFWPTSDAPKYVTGFSITTALIALTGVCAIVLKWKYGDKGVRHAEEELEQQVNV